MAKVAIPNADAWSAYPPIQLAAGPVEVSHLFISTRPDRRYILVSKVERDGRLRSSRTACCWKNGFRIPGSLYTPTGRQKRRQLWLWAASWTWKTSSPESLAAALLISSALARLEAMTSTWKSRTLFLHLLRFSEILAAWWVLWTLRTNAQFARWNMRWLSWSCCCWAAEIVLTDTESSESVVTVTVNCWEIGRWW